MLIMVLCGFAGYMSHIGANTILVKLASKPLGIIKSPTYCWWPPTWWPAPCRWR